MLRIKRWVAIAVMAVVASMAALVPAQPAAASPESCAAVIAGAAAGGPVGWGGAAVSATYCGGWMGDMNAGYICWVSRQQWGFWAHWLVGLITGGKYSRC